MNKISYLDLKMTEIILRIWLLDFSSLSLGNTFCTRQKFSFHLIYPQISHLQKSLSLFSYLTSTPHASHIISLVFYIITPSPDRNNRTIPHPQGPSLHNSPIDPHTLISRQASTVYISHCQPYLSVGIMCCMWPLLHYSFFTLHNSPHSFLARIL